MKRLVVLGSDGMLGSAFMEVLSKKNKNFIGLTINDIDITEYKSVCNLKNYHPDIIINCAAYTAVDQAEKEPSTAQAVNTLGVKNLALFAKAQSLKLVHFSTDYVFSGDKKLYIETDDTEPINTYGNSKLQGEKELANNLSTSQYLLLRTAWLYGSNGKNFVQTMINLAQNRKELNVVGDQFGVPTYTKDLVRWTLDLLEIDADGIYHAVNAGSISWCEFAKRIFQLQEQDIKVNCITTEEYPTLAKRPKYSILDNSKLQKVLKYKIRNWEEALSEYLISIKI